MRALRPGRAAWPETLTPAARTTQAKQFRLDVSMLDRLAHNGVDCASLGYQHRTRPQIARLLSPVYESLPDCAPVGGWPGVRGIERALFFLKHEKARTRMGLQPPMHSCSLQCTGLRPRVHRAAASDA